MSAGLEIKSASAAYRHTPTHHMQTKVFMPYPYSHNFVAAGENGEILPYMAQTHSPVRVTYTPGPSPKRKSRVSDQARTAVFNFRPLQRGDRQFEALRFKAPDATLPTPFMSPWVSVTRLDYKNPRSEGDLDESEYRDLLPQELFRRSQTDSEIASRNGTTCSQSRSATMSETNKIPTLLTTGSSVSSVPEFQDTQELRSSLKSCSTDKRVTIVDPTDCLLDMDTADIEPKSFTTSPAASPKTRMRNIKCSDNENYYSGYLPPELSDKIAAKLDINTVEKSLDDNVDKRDLNSMFKSGGQYYKPLVGDRSLFMREAYPVQPKLYQSDIDKLRFEGHERLIHANGQNTAHFSALKDKGTTIRPTKRGVRIDEAVRRQQRLTKSAVNPRRFPAQGTSIETYQRQRERTYHLQNMAREMINK